MDPVGVDRSEGEPGVVQYREALGDVAGHEQRAACVPWRRCLGHAGRERPARRPLEHDVGPAAAPFVRLADLDHTQDAGMIDAGGGARRRAEPARGQDPHHDLAAEAEVEREEGVRSARRGQGRGEAEPAGDGGRHHGEPGGLFVAVGHRCLQCRGRVQSPSGVAFIP